MSKQKLQQILTRRLGLKAPRFKLARLGPFINGSVVSQTFAGMDDLKRQHSIWDALEAEMGNSAWKQVGMILAYTPDEWDLDEPEQPRRSRNGSRPVAAKR